MWRRCDSALRVSGGFWLLLGWFLYANGWRLLLTVLAAAGLHECGHYAVLRLLGARVVSMRVGIFGAEMRASGALSYAGELAAVLAGPAANLTTGLLLAGAGEPGTAAALACGTVWLMAKTGGSLWLLPAAVGFAASAWREVVGKRSFL